MIHSRVGFLMIKDGDSYTFRSRYFKPPTSCLPRLEVPVSEFWPYYPNHTYDPRDIWPVVDERIEIRPGLDLVVRKFGYDTVCFVQGGTMGRMLAGSSDNAEVESVTPDAVRLRCYISEEGFRCFPLQIIYYVDKDERIEDPLYLDCAVPFRFNYYVKKDEHQPPPLLGDEVLDLEVLDDTVTIKFGPAIDDCIAVRVPETATTFDESTCTFNLMFVGSKVAEAVMKKAGGLGPTAACRSLSLVQTPEGVQLSIDFAQPMEYRVDYTSAGRLSMTVWLTGK